MTGTISVASASNPTPCGCSMPATADVRPPCTSTDPRGMSSRPAERGRFLGAALWVWVVLLCASCGLTAHPASPAPGEWLYVNSVQSGKLHVFDLATGSSIRVIPVEDHGGSIGMAATADGKGLYIIDGDT